MSGPPTGTVTFLFTDIEGSTQLWERNPEAMRPVLERHNALLQAAIQAHNGHVFKTIGDAFCAVFAAPAEALQAALSAQRALHTESWPADLPLRVRMALHTGTVEESRGDYFGPPLNRVARLLAIGHGGQVLLSEAAEGLASGLLPEGASLRDMGLHRLKDLQQPEHVWQLCHPDLPDDFLPLRSLSPETTNLPVQATSFIGREREIAQIKGLLFRTRLLTLTGSGGCGKTRLALQVAADLLEEYQDGVWLAELAPLSDPDLVAQTIAGVLGLREEPGKPLTHTLVEHLKSKRLLLLLDNCEHVLEACVRLADAFLKQCPHLRLLITSRQALGIAGEALYRVPSLGLPDLEPLPPAEVLAQTESVRLFAARAQAVLPTFAVTLHNAPALAHICRRLDGIPLALELAAARVRALPVEQMEARLSDRFRLLTGGSRTALPRQQTLRALIDWSYDLLTQQERTLLHRLSAFAGGATLEACEQVCAGEEVEEWEVLDVLTSLVDKSLVVYEEREGTARYRLLETIREYARQKLTQTEEGESLQARHRDYFLSLTEEAKEKLRGPEQAEWLERLETEHDNLRAALDCCLEQKEGTETGLRLAGALSRFWLAHGYLSEGRQRLARALEREAGSEPSKAWAEALEGAGLLAWMQGDYTAARSLFEQSLARRQELGDKQGIASSLNNLGNIAYEQGDYASARSLYEQSLDIQRELGDKRGIAIALSNLGMVAYDQRDYASARTLQEESLALRRELGDKQGIAISLGSLGLILFELGSYTTARMFLAECLALCHELGEKYYTTQALEGLAKLAHAQHQPERAARLYGAAQALREAIGAPLPQNERAEYERIQADLRAALGEDGYQAGLAAGHSLSLEQTIAYALEESAAGKQA